jgi:hypothetical protein
MRIGSHSTSRTQERATAAKRRLIDGSGCRCKAGGRSRFAPTACPGLDRKAPSDPSDSPLPGVRLAPRAERTYLRVGRCRVEPIEGPGMALGGRPINFGRPPETATLTTGMRGGVCRQGTMIFMERSWFTLTRIGRLPAIRQISSRTDQRPGGGIPPLRGRRRSGAVRERQGEETPFRFLGLIGTPLLERPRDGYGR